MAALPGLADSLTPLEDTSDGPKSQEVVIPANHEWRVESPPDTKLVIKVKSGIAEIFGIELALEQNYTFQGMNFALFAVEMVELQYSCLDFPKTTISDDTNMKYIYNLHFSFEKMRISSFDGPKVLIVGDSCSGKTSLAKILCSYALKIKSYQPVLVNLNPQEGVYSAPGCISATPISDIIDVTTPTWGQSMTSGATKLHCKQPIVKSFGLENISDNKHLYKTLVQDLGQVLLERLQNDPVVRRSGFIIDTPPVSQLLDDLELFKLIVKTFKVNAIVVCATTDDLAIKIDEILKTQTITIVRLPQSSGVVAVDDVHKRFLQRNAIKEYFYGDHNVTLSPYVAGVDFDMVTVWQPPSILENHESDPTDLLPVEVNSSNLQHALIAITYAPRRASKDEVLHSPILGFGLIMEVNDVRKKLRILLPVPGNLPDKAMILTAYRYLE
ncbi:LAMI_0F03994g1_1 [Lachancea mirantina]|uniref:Polynucleotide 5'-hydroxyl-kinase GRC3 n=1 Tax=Lachancea mirantina TaxID=1230905 RepID=A0A1G4JXJ1_9SACH|nr:LAMI_0F03994g1_1 [Lachancea mirantina]